METLEKIDHSAIKVSQITIIGLNILAFLLDIPWLAALVAVNHAPGSAVQSSGVRLHLPFLS